MSHNFILNEEINNEGWHVTLNKAILQYLPAWMYLLDTTPISANLQKGDELRWQHVSTGKGMDEPACMECKQNYY